jgi:tubby-related protein 1
MSEEATQSLIDHDHNDIDDDDDHLNSAHKIVPTTFKPTLLGTNQQAIQTSEESPVSNTNQLNNFDIDIQNLIKNDLTKYLNTSISKDYSGFVHCHINREHAGLTKAFSTTFSLYFDGQNENDHQTFLLSARKHLTIGGHSEYFIGINPENPSNLSDENSIAKLRGMNITDTEYILYDHQNSSNNQKQSTAIIYDEHIFGSREPRKFTVLLYDNEKTSQSLKENETIIDEWRSGHGNDLIELKNKAPTYDEESGLYTLTFYGNRVQQASHQNFQLVTSDQDQENNVAMQFGRIDENNFSLDYRYPLTIIQAFAIALSAFHRRFRT